MIPKTLECVHSPPNTFRNVPSKYTTWRPQQLKAINELIDAYNCGYKVLCGTFPVGFGKSLMGVVFGSLFPSYSIAMNSIELQLQYEKEFTNIPILYGKGKYVCNNLSEKKGQTIYGGCVLSTGAKCNYLKEGMCEFNCARESVIDSHAGIYNYMSMLMNVVISEKIDPMDIAIFDEAHTLEDIMTNFLTLSFSTRDCNRLIRIVSDFIYQSGRSQQDSLIMFLKHNLIPEINKLNTNIEKIYEKSISLSSDEKEVSETDFVDFMEDFEEDFNSILNKLNNCQDIEVVEVLNWIKDKITTVNRVISVVDDTYHITITKGYDNQHNVKGYYTFSARPTMPNLGRKYLDQCGEVKLFMSGTVSKADVELLGYNDDEIFAISTPSDFPEKNRYFKCTNQFQINSDFLKSQDNLKLIVRDIIKNIVIQNGNNGIIHTISYKLMEDIYKLLPNQVSIKGKIIPIKSKCICLSQNLTLDQRSEILQKFKNGNNMIILSPTLTTGVDFEYDSCRWQYLIKVPYLPLDSYTNKKKTVLNNIQKGLGQKWYALKAARVIDQTYGRPNRHNDDYSITICPDKNIITDKLLISHISKYTASGMRYQVGSNWYRFDSL